MSMHGLVVSLMICFIFTHIYGRVGETRLLFEKRLNDSGGFQYRDEKVLSNRKRGMPYLGFLNFLPKKSELKIYYKTIDGRKPLAKDIRINSMLEGWDIHIIYVNEKSVFELYKRSEKINDFEFAALLKIQSGQSFWKKKDPTQANPKDDISAFGYDFLRDDNLLKAKKIGNNTLIIFSSDFDLFIEKEKDSEQKEKLPASIKGF